MKEIPLSYLLGQIVAKVFIISPSVVFTANKCTCLLFNCALQFRMRTFTETGL